MKENINTKYDMSIRRRVTIFSGLLILLLALGSSLAGAEDVYPSPELGQVPEFAPLSDEYISYTENDVGPQPEPSPDEHPTGYIPPPVDLDHLSLSIQETAFPAYYDLRTLDKVTSVKDQGSAGTCWAFASYASLESYLMSGENWDFSENNMKNLLSSSYSEGFDRDSNGGGNSFQAAAYLTQWSGPVQESDDPYSTSSGVSPEDLPSKKHIQNVLFIPKRTYSLDNDAIKWAVQNYGAVYTSMYYNNTFYSQSNCSYYYDGTLVSNHAVAVVGWDDSFDRNRFSQVPPGDGAFIMKNSWGSDWGEDGYFYVSYYDSKIGIDNTVFTAENPDNYKSIYQYDPLGWVSSLGYTGSTTAWCANVFTAESDEALKAVGFYTTDSNCNYEIYVYVDPTSGPINQTGPILSMSGRSLTAGYNTVSLDSSVELTAGQKFSVVLKLLNPAYKYPIPVERPISGYSSKAKANAGESFISSAGATWYDLQSYSAYQNTNVCIKAFTDLILLPVADFSTSVTSGYVPLSVQFTDLSENAKEWNWDFGDGATSNDQNPAHTYSTAGTYTVTLEISNEYGTDSKTATIDVLKSTPRINWFNPADITNGTALSNIQLNAVATDPATGDSVPGTYVYTPTSGTLLSGGTHILHVDFTPADTTNYNTASKDVSINVLEPLFPPIASFRSNITSGDAPLTVQFTDLSVDAPEWSWDFGDKTYSTDKNPVHTYDKPGKYTVSLTVKNSKGTDTEEKAKYISVYKIK